MMGSVLRTLGELSESTDRILRLRDELVQVAAVAIAAATDLIYTTTHQGGHSIRTDPIFEKVWEERQRQEEKWGAQHHDMRVWMAILMEEVGESADEIPLNDHPSYENTPDVVLDRIVEEIQNLGQRARNYLETQ